MPKIAIQGIRGSYSEEAALKFFDAAEILCCSDFEQTFEAVSSNRSAYAVVPFKNKIVGEIEKPLLLLKSGEFRILDETALEIRHVLIGTAKAKFDELKLVESHPEALKQCRRFLLENKQIQAFAGCDTASSVKKITEAGKSERSAIGSLRAAKIYGGRVLREKIADDEQNVTWFYLLEKIRKYSR